jgi:hypothetical protein
MYVECVKDEVKRSGENGGWWGFMGWSGFVCLG